MASYKTLIFCAPQGIPTAMHAGYAHVAASSSSSLFIAYENETWNRRVIRTEGSFSGLAVLRGGDTHGTDVLTFRRNGVDTDLQATTVSGSDDDEDATHEEAVAVDDYVSFKGSISAARRWIRALFSPAADATQVSLFGIRGNGSFFAVGAWLADNATNYLPFCGGPPLGNGINTSESRAKVRLKTAGSFRNVSVHVVKNGSTIPVTLRSRVNGADGNISIAIPARATGTFSDLVNSDTIAVDDEFCFSCSGAATFRVEFSSLYCEFAHSVINGEQDIYCGRPAGGVALSPSVGTQYYTPVGDLFYAGSPTDAGAAITFGMDCGAKLFRLKVTTNTCSNDQVFTLVKNGAATAVTFTVGAGLTGEFIDASHQISLLATDTLSISHTGDGTGALGVEYFAMVIPGEASGATPEPEEDECGTEDEPDAFLPADVTWDECVLVPEDISVDVVSPTVSPGRSLAGREKVVQPDAGFWRIELVGIKVWTDAELLLWREYESTLNGRNGTVLVPLYEAALSATPIAAVADADYAIGAVRIGIEQTAGAAIRNGLHCSAGEWGYRIKRVFGTAGGVTSELIWPPLRRAIAADEVLDFNTPRVRCRLERDDGMAIDLELLRFAKQNVAFLEDV